MADVDKADVDTADVDKAVDKAEDEAPWGGGLWQAADLVTPMAIRVAATLRVADHITAGRRTAAALADATGADAESLDRVLRHLVTSGHLDLDEAGAYSLTGSGEYLRSDHPDGIRAWIDLDGAVGRADLCLVRLLDTVMTGEPAFPLHFGSPFWTDLAADADRTASFDALMGAQLAAEAPAVAAAYDWGALGHVVDVGGGDGSLLIALLEAHPALRGTVVDLPAAAETTRRRIERAGLDGRAEAVAGSFFDPLPVGAGGYLLSAVLLDWDDADARAILERCAEAAGPAGKVLVVEGMGDDRGGSPSTEMDLRMLAYFRGRQRDLSGLAALARTAGLEVTGISPARNRSVVELTSGDAAS